MSKFFIHRPIFAIVISLLIVIIGVLAAVQLPIAQYPQISPPTISVSTTYVGANAKTVNETVAQVIEQQVMVLRVWTICPLLQQIPVVIV